MKPRFVSFPYTKVSAAEVTTRARRFYELMNSRRTVRDFSSEPVPASVIEDLVRTASTAPSGAHRQPWTFVAVSDPQAKRQIRIAAEKEERENYDGRMPPDWLAALEPLGTDAHKPFLEVAPWLVVLFKQNYGVWARTTRTSGTTPSPSRLASRPACSSRRSITQGWSRSHTPLAPWAS